LIYCFSDLYAKQQRASSLLFGVTIMVRNKGECYVSYVRGLGIRAAVIGSNYELLLGLCVMVRVD